MGRDDFELGPECGKADVLKEVVLDSSWTPDHGSREVW